MPAAPPAYSLDTLSGEAAAPPYAGNQPAQVARRAAVRLAAVAPPGPWTSDRYAQVNHYTGLVYCAAKAKRDALVAATVTATKLRPRKRFKAVSSPRPHTHDEDRVPVPEGHPLAELFADPNDQDTVGDLLGDLVVQQDLHGVALLWHPLNAKGRPARLHVLPASAVQYIPPSGLYPQGGYTVTFAGTYTPLAVPGAGWSVSLDKREVLEIRDRHPRVWYGTWGPLDAGAEWVDLARGIDISQKRAFDHGFSPDVVLSIDGATSDVIDAVEAQIKARYEGRDGRKVLVADGTGVKAEKLNTTPREMDYASSKDMATKQVLALFGVNSTVAGLTDADSYASLYAKLRQFYGGTMANLCQRWSAAFTKHLARRFYGSEYAVEVTVPTPDDPDRLDKQRDAAMSAGAITVNEYRGQLDLDPWPDGDVPGFEFQARRQQAMQPQQPAMAPGMGGDEMPPEAGGDDPAAGVADALADALTGGAMAKAVGDALVGDYTEGEVKKDKRGRRYKVVGGKRVPVGDRADEPKQKPGGGAGQRGGSADEPPVPKGHVRYYHGGHLRSQNGAGPRWFSTSREYAQGYADKSGEHGSVSFVDVPHDHPDVGRTAARWDRAGNETGWEFAPNVEFGHDIASKRRVLLAGKENATVPPANRRRQFDAGGDGPLPVSDAPAVDWRREGGGGKAVVKAAEPVMARALPTLAKRYTGPAIAKRVRSPGWAEQSAKQHAGRVARATGLDERTAAGVLLHYLERFADLVGKPFKPLANAIDFVNSDEFQGESWAATGRRLVGGPPRPNNPAGGRSLPKRKAVSVEYSDPAPYGYCPECRTPGVLAERRPNGDAQCGNGHRYPLAKAKYASTQIDLTGPAAERLRALAAAIPDADLADDGRETDPHVTVRYGLHADAPGPVAAAVAGFGSVQLHLNGLSAFRGKEYDVIYATVNSPDLLRLHAALAALPHTDTHRTYVPHATVAYVKPGLADKYLASLGWVDVAARVGRLTFSTAGREHTDIPLIARKAMSAYCDGAGGELVPPAVARRGVKLKRAKRFAARVVKSLGLTEATHAG